VVRLGVVVGAAAVVSMVAAVVLAWVAITLVIDGLAVLLRYTPVAVDVIVDVVRVLA